MLTRRAKAYSSSCLQIALIYPQPFRLKVRGAADNCKKTMKPLILEFRIFHSYRHWYD